MNRWSGWSKNSPIWSTTSSRKLSDVSATRCPVCRARLKAQATCPRCGSDLTLVETIRQQAKNELAQALSRAAEGDFEHAATAARRSAELRLTPLSRLLPGFIERLESKDANIPKDQAMADGSRTPPRPSRSLAARLIGLFDRLVGRNAYRS